METMKRLTLLLFLTLPAAGQAEDYTYTTNNGTLTITYYDGPGGDVIIPKTLNGLPVTAIGHRAFSGVGFRAYAFRVYATGAFLNQ